MTDSEEIQRFQDNLFLIRQLAGWTEEEFATKIGITRQTMSNLEKNKSKLGKTQYIAMRHVLKEKIITSTQKIINEKDNEGETEDILAWILETLIDNPDCYSEDDREFILEKAKMLAPAIYTKSSTRNQVTEDFIKILKPLGVISGAIILGIIGFKGIRKR